MPNIILYGAFINERSLYKTIAPRETKIILVKGYKRVLNLIPSRMELYKNKADHIHRTVFNAIPNEKSKFNALMISTTDDEFELLKLRERSYNTKKIKVILNNNQEDAYLFVGKSKLFGEEILDNTLLPIHPYILACKEGAKAKGEEFYKNWVETSFLGDGTPLKEYMKEQNL